jgi:CRP-like cAMP-binding protein
MLQPSHAPADNRLLAALPARERRRLLAGCQRIEFDCADVLCKPGKRIRHVFFPLEGCISVLAPAAGGTSLDAALIGDEGMLGASLMLGLKIAPHQGQVQHAGQAWRMETESFLRELQRSRELRQKLKRYLYVTLMQLAQTTTCNRFHVVEARLARWLLMSRDRMHADGFPITHERLGHSLGARRVGITRAANSLQQRMLIRYRHGNLLILDRRGLEAAACGCYAADKEIYRRLMS